MKIYVPLALLFISGLLLAGCSFSPQKSTPSKLSAPVSSPSAEEDMASWKSYTDSRTGFEVRVPQSFTTTELCGGEDLNGPTSCSGVDIADPANTDLTLHLEVLPKEAATSLESFVRDTLKDEDVSDNTPTTIAGHTARSVTFKGSITLDSVEELVEADTHILFVEKSPTEVLIARYPLEACKDTVDNKTGEASCSPLNTAVMEKILSTLSFK